MDLVKNKFNSMKEQADYSEDRIKKFESTLRVSKQQLEAALKEKECLCRKIEAVEAQIINSDRTRSEILERLKDVEDSTDSSESRRKALENRELKGDEALGKLEDRLRTVREKYKENTVCCEEGQRRLTCLKEEYEKVRAHRIKKEEEAVKLEAEIEVTARKLHDFEKKEQKSQLNEYKCDDHMKLLESYHQEADEKRESQRLNVLRLKRLIEQTQDDIERVQMQTRATRIDLKNTVQAVVNEQ